MSPYNRWILIGTIGLLGIGVWGGVFPPVSLAQEAQGLDPFPKETQRLLEQYRTLEVQSLALVEKVKRYEQDRARIEEEGKALKKALESSEKARHELEDQYVTLLQTVTTLQDDRRKVMMDQGVAQKLATTLQKQVAILKQRQEELETLFREAEQSYQTEQAQNKEIAKKLIRSQKALKAYEKANVDQQLQVVELQSLSRESRLAFNYELGRIYARSGMYDSAIAEFQKTLDLDPNYAEAYRSLGVIYREHLMRSDLASTYFRRYLELRPEAGDIEQIRGWLIKTKKEIDTKNDAERWGGGFFRNLSRIFY